MLGSVLGRINFKAWIPFVLVWITFRVHGQRVPDLGRRLLRCATARWTTPVAMSSTLAAGISGFVAAAVIGPRLQRDREVDAPNNLLMVAAGAGLLWLGWNGFQRWETPTMRAPMRRRPVLNTNVWHGGSRCSCGSPGDYIFRDKPSLIGSVNGMITGLVAITPAAGFVTGWGAIAIGFDRLDVSCGWRSGS